MATGVHGIMPITLDTLTLDTAKHFRKNTQHFNLTTSNGHPNDSRRNLPLTQQASIQGTTKQSPPGTDIRQAILDGQHSRRRIICWQSSSSEQAETPANVQAVDTSAQLR